MDGIYAAYLSGKAGNSVGIFLFKGGIVSGADIGGAIYDGQYSATEDGLHVVGTLTMDAPPNTPLITGTSSADPNSKMPIPFRFPKDINEADVYKIETPAGPVNAKFRKIRSL